MRRLVEGIYVEDEQSTPPNFHGCNPSFITTDAGVVMIDTPMFPSDAMEWHNQIAEEGEVKYLINTDYHEDHTTGNHFFDGEIVSHALTKWMLEAPPTRVLRGAVEDLLERELNPDLTRVEITRRRIEELDPEGASLLDEDYHFRRPTTTFTEELELEVGDTTFELMHLPGHTRGHIGVYVPEEDVFFAGDNVTTRVYPSLVEAMPLEWIETLKTIESIDPDWIVPGHGTVCDVAEVTMFRKFLEDQIEHVTNCINDGMAIDRIVETVTFDGRPAIHADSSYHRRDIERLHEKLFYG